MERYFCSSVYYSLRRDFKYNKVSTSVNIQEIPFVQLEC